jgi:hypothetical protein
MEILELLNLCGCLLEMAALFSSGTATYSGVQVYRHRKKGAPSEQPAHGSSRVLGFIVLLIVALGFLVLVALKWSAAVA